MTQVVSIQMFDHNLWRTCQAGVPNDSNFVRNALNEIKSVYPDKPVRAVDANGNVVDIMP